MAGMRQISRKDLHDVAEQLGEVVAQLKGWSTSGGGINVVSDSDVERRQAEWIEGYEEQRQQIEADRRSGASGNADGS